MDKRQETAFWETIEIFDVNGLLPYIMIIGSWAEYIYSEAQYFSTDFKPNLRTRDIDFLYGNIRKPNTKINITQALIQKGYSYTANPASGKSKFIKEDLLELEFLTRVHGGGSQQFYDIPSIGIRAEGLRDVNILNDYPLELKVHGFSVIVPEPGVYVIQKILTNPHRMPVHKREKDIDAVRMLLTHINKSEHDKAKLQMIFDGLTNKEHAIIARVCDKHFLELFYNRE